MRTVQASTLVLLLLLASLGTVLQPASAADTTVTSETTWSGTIVLTGNVTVANGTTLTISPGTTIDAGDDHWLRVEGSLFATDTTFLSSATPLTQGSHGAGLWVGLQIESNGHAQLTNVVINNSKTAVRNHGSLTASVLTINDAYIGINNGGSATLSDVVANDIDYDVVRSTGTLSVEDATFTNVAGGIISSGTSDVSDVSFYQTGLALKATSGHLQASGIAFDGVTVGIASQAGATTSVASVIGSNVALAVDAGDSDDLTLDTMVISGHRLLLANGATQIQAQDITFTGNLNESRAVLDQRCSGSCTWNNTVISNTVWGLALSGNGHHTFNDLTATSSLRNLDASGTGELTMSIVHLNGSDAAISLRGPSSTIEEATIHSMSSEALAIDVLDGVHAWKNIEATKPYSSQDLTSIGLKAWYSTITTEGFSIAQYGNAIQL
ncbi:hypothetical protein N9V17_02960, partial [Candidatus Poseidoniales archaeon]|nr:hypothetical protein [Candidatus Poseidoniales archaeon]